ncbi:MAG: NB-ARC domain-containing protein, partial [Cyanobacteria bacterium P01_A01_bin.37]
FKGSWYGQTYDVMAEESGYSSSYLTRIVGPKFWKHLSQALGQKVSKNSFRLTLEQWHHHQGEGWRGEGLREGEGLKGSGTVPSSTVSIDWGEAPDVTTFYGRQTELDTLSRLVITDQCRLVSVLGMGGIGKTALTAKFVDTLVEQADYSLTHLIWRSLRNAPSLKELLEDLVPFVSNQDDTEATPTRLLYWLRQFRCLIVLDNMETILQGGAHAGHFRPGYECYGDVLQLIGESRHQSHLVLTSREKPAVVGTLEGIDSSVRSLKLLGSSEAALALLDAKGLIGTVEEKQQLGNDYGNSPLALKIVSTSIRSLFDGKISLFLAENTLVFNGLQRLLDQQFDRLANVEKTVMYWLAINREWTSISELVDDIQPVTGRQQILQALESLSWRNLIETQSGHYTQQPVVMEYVTDRFVDQIGTALINLGQPTESLIAAPAASATPAAEQGKLLFYSHAFLKTTVKDYVRESQIRLIVEPIVAQLRSIFPTSQAIAQQVQFIFKTLRYDLASSGADKAPVPSYGAGNVLNLCHHLNVSLENYDFSGLTIWHADLQPVQLHRVNLTRACIAKTSFSQHFSAISAVEFSPDGRLLAVGDSQGQIHLWRTSDLQPCLTLEGHVGWVQALCFSTDGTYLISAGDDHVTNIWKIRQITTISFPSQRTDGSPSLRFSGVLFRVLKGHQNRIWSVALSPDGQLLATGSGDCTVKLWSLKTGQLLATTDAHANQVTSVHFSPDGHMLASSGFDQTIKRWDIHRTPDGVELHLVQTLEGHQGSVWSVRFHPYAPLLVSSSGDRTIKIWQLPTGKLLTTLRGHTEQISTLEICPSGNHLVSASNDHTLKLWDISQWVGSSGIDNGATTTVIATLTGHTRQIWTMALSPDGTMLASGSNDQTVRLWDIPSRRLFNTIRGHTNQLLTVGVSALSATDAAGPTTYLMTGSSDQTIRLWDFQTGTLTHTLRGHKNWVLSVAPHPTELRLASGSADCDIRLWNLKTGVLTQVLSGHTSWVWSVAFSPDGRMLASGSFDQTIRLWDVQTASLLQTIQVTDLVWSVTFSPDGQWLASGDNQHRVQVWDVATGTLITTLEGHTGPVWSVAFSPNEKMLASGSSDGTVHLWDLSPYPHPPQLLTIFQGHQSWVRTVAFSLDGAMLASGSYDNTIRLWDVQQRANVSILQGHQDWVMAIAFCPEPSTESAFTLISSSTDATLKIWNSATGLCNKTLRIERPYEGMTIEGIQGLTDGQIAVLMELGAVKHAQSVAD